MSAPAAPYPPSTVVRGIEWHWETYTNAGIGSDLWPVTWGPDDNLYTAWGDGGGFGGGDHDGRVAMGFARIEGFPPNWRGINVNGGKNPEHPPSFPKKGKTGGLICVHGALYALVNLQDGTWPDVNHALAWSTNLGATWERAGWVFAKGPGNFRPSNFLNFGKDNGGVPEYLGGYVYVYGSYHGTASESQDWNCLARLPEDRLKDQTAYQYFQGVDAGAQPKWTSASGESQPVFIDPNGGISSAVYSPALRRFLVTITIAVLAKWEFLKGRRRGDRGKRFITLRILGEWAPRAKGSSSSFRKNG